LKTKKLLTGKGNQGPARLTLGGELNVGQVSEDVDNGGAPTNKKGQTHMWKTDKRGKGKRRRAWGTRPNLKIAPFPQRRGHGLRARGGVSTISKEKLELTKIKTGLSQKKS